jgi:ferredoxin
MAKINVTNRLGEDRAVPRIDSNPAISILNSLLMAGVRIRHDCGGKALCGTCALRVLSGEAGMSPVERREEERLAAGGGQAGYRLACQARTARDIDIEVVLD